MAQDYEVSRKVWDAQVPVEVLLDSDGPDARPFYAMLPRCSYLSVHINKILQFLASRDDSEPFDMDKVWLESGGQPVKTYYPIGLLYDVMGKETWTITVKTGRSELGNTMVSRDEMEKIFMQSVKEADFLKHKSEVVSTMKSEDYHQLWNGVARSAGAWFYYYSGAPAPAPLFHAYDLRIYQQSLVHGRFEEFWAVNKRLMEHDAKGFIHVPLRLYIENDPFKQVPITHKTESGEDTTLEEALKLLARDVAVDKFRFVSHGVEIPLETPVGYLTKNFSYPDNFVHICAVPV